VKQSKSPRLSFKFLLEFSFYLVFLSIVYVIMMGDPSILEFLTRADLLNALLTSSLTVISIGIALLSFLTLVSKPQDIREEALIVRREEMLKGTRRAMSYFFTSALFSLSGYIVPIKSFLIEASALSVVFFLHGWIRLLLVYYSATEDTLKALEILRQPKTL